MAYFSQMKSNIKLKLIQESDSTVSLIEIETQLALVEAKDEQSKRDEILNENKELLGVAKELLDFNLKQVNEHFDSLLQANANETNLLIDDYIQMKLNLKSLIFIKADDVKRLPVPIYNRDVKFGALIIFDWYLNQTQVNNIGCLFGKICSLSQVSKIFKK